MQHECGIFMTFWDVLFDNLVLVHVLLPCVAGVVVCLLPRRKTGIARFLVFQMSLLSVACGIAMLLRFDPSQPSAESPMLAQMATFHVWQPVKQIPAIRLAVGVDGLNLWYLISLPWVVLSLLLWESAKREWGRRDIICLTWATAGTLLAFAARDLMLLATGASVAFLSILAWSRHTTNSSPRQQARSVQGLAAWGVATAAVFLFGASVGGVSSLQVQEQGRTQVPSVPLEIDELVFGVPAITRAFPRSQEVWRQQGSTIFLAWCTAALLCVGAVPMQEVLLRTLQRLTPAPRALVLSGLIPIGGYILARMTLPMLGTIVVVGQGWITWPVLITLVWHLAKTGQGVDRNEGVLRLTLSAQSLALVGIISGTVSGICGGVIVSLVSSGLAVAWSLLPSNASTELPSGNAVASEQATGDLSRWPGRFQFLTLSLLAGFPGGGMFAGFWLLATGIIQGPQQRFLSGSLLLGVVSLLWLLLVRTVERLPRGPVSPREGTSESRSLGAVAGGMCLLVLVILAGIVPGKVVATSLRTAEIVTQSIPVLLSPGG